MEIGIPGTDSSDPVFAHKNSGMRIVDQIAGEVRQLQNASSATSACRCVGTRTARPGEASSAMMNSHAAGALHGRRMTRG